MDLGVAGRVALVGASTSGLGEAVARALGAEGARVVVTGRRGDRAREIAAELPQAIGVEVDLGDPDAVDAMLKVAIDAFGPPEIVVLNGPGPKPGRAAELSPEAVSSALGSLLGAHVGLVSRVLPAMRAAKWGRILAIGSSGVLAPLPNLALSNLGRQGLGGYLKTLAAEVAADGVTVNLLLPGRIGTRRVAELDQMAADARGIAVEEVVTESLRSIPAGRYGRPEEFGALAAFLCSAAASYVTGTATRCDGGLHRQL